MISWNEAILNLPGASPHIFQTQVWALNKAQTGWQPFYLAWYQDHSGYALAEFDSRSTQPCASALVLRREIKIRGFSARLGVLYVPKGPLLDWSNAKLRRQVLEDLGKFSKRRSGIFIKIDPDVRVSTGYPNMEDHEEDPHWTEIQNDLLTRGWIASKEQIQFKNTMLIDLTQTEEQILAKMKPKSRYNIRLAEKKGIAIRTGNLADLDLLYRMYAETSVRDGFVIRDASYYRHTWHAFMEAGLAEALIAEFEGEPVAAVILFRFNRQAWYIYGMSRDVHREKMPNHLLQWEAIRRAKAAGCNVYDLWGAPDEPIETDPLWGVFRLKKGLGAEVLCTMGAWDLPTRPWSYQLYTEILPRILARMRQRGKQKTLQEVSL